MVIENIDADLCTGCGICDDCPMDVIRMDERTGKAIIKYPEDCRSPLCNLCEMECPQHAVYISISPARQIPLTSWGY